VTPRRRRWGWGWRERVRIIPGLVWLNFSKSGVSVSFHAGIATWNSRTGWRFHGPMGLYIQERRRRRRA
jgi:hypothetical protein